MTHFPPTAVLLLLLSSSTCSGQVAFSNSLGDHAVLQRGVTNTVWGLAPGAITAVNVTLASAAGPTVFPASIDAARIFRAVLPPMPASMSAFNITATASDGSSHMLTDLLIGDVFLCSGQSNMQFSVQMAFNSSAEIAAANDFPLIRVTIVAGAPADTPQADLTTPALPWSVASNASIGGAGFSGFSAVCWFFGRDTFLALGSTIPIGLIDSSVGGTAIRQWTPTAALARCPQPYNSPAPYGTKPYAHSTLFNGMIAPFSTGPTSLSAVVWLQAESDSYPQTPPGYYTCQGPAQINAWRTWLQHASLPWMTVQITPYIQDDLAGLRQEQLAGTALLGVGYVPASDLGDPTSPYGSVHSRNKQPVGARLASLAQRLVYGSALPPGSQYASYPPPSFLCSAASSGINGTLTVAVTLDAPANVVANTSVACPTAQGVPQYLCTAFSIQTNDTAWWPATLQSLQNNGDGTATATLSLSLPAPQAGALYAVGSAYAWSSWPLVQLTSEDGWPVLPWNQSLIMMPPWEEQQLSAAVDHNAAS